MRICLLTGETLPGQHSDGAPCLKSRSSNVAHWPGENVMILLGLPFPTCALWSLKSLKVFFEHRFFFILVFYIVLSTFAKQTIELEVWGLEKIITFMKLHLPQRGFRGEGRRTCVIAPCLLLFFVLFLSCFIFQARLVNGPVLDNISPPSPPHPSMHSVGCIFPEAFAHSPTYSLNQLAGITHPLRHSTEKQAACHGLFISCFNFHYYVSQEMHALANSYWHKKVFEFLPTFGENWMRCREEGCPILCLKFSFLFFFFVFFLSFSPWRASCFWRWTWKTLIALCKEFFVLCWLVLETVLTGGRVKRRLAEARCWSI